MISKEIRIDCDECGACDNATTTSMKEAEKLFLGIVSSEHTELNGIGWFKKNGKHYCRKCFGKLGLDEKEKEVVKDEN